ncbi:MAG: N-acetyltransferase [Bacteroidetes bacterium]|nr:MAG: N-acetyltransferase [Bacteroidota bacterium]REK07664.1 MAG: N-acetyltransferase [Bacteroidota bacterium]REK33736.1 MAG: N-acetyltransferase [Bacteroidota bacterium]REK49206.1 MAG: N-acetyltransferase [Bacteroidota bacterium]
MEYKLRPFREKDAEILSRFANNERIARFMTDKFPHPYSADHARSFIEFANSHDPQRIFAIEVEGQAAGGIGIHPQEDIHRKNAELGYWLAEEYWNRGIVSRAVKEMVEYGFRTFDISRIFARPFGNNIASQRVLLHAGFVLETVLEKTLYKNGEYLDEMIFSVRLNDLETE